MRLRLNLTARANAETLIPRVCLGGSLGIQFFQKLERRQLTEYRVFWALNCHFFFSHMKYSVCFFFRIQPFPDRILDIGQRFFACGALGMATFQSGATDGKAFFGFDQENSGIHKELHRFK
jgi:hypothetical protein